MIKYISCVICFLFFLYNVSAQNICQKELQSLHDISLLPTYQSGKLYQISSYDRSGGNDDGFSGKYSYLRKEGNSLVIADLKGAGVVNRIWTPTPTADTIKFFFDGESTPRISMPFINLFSGKEYPFVSPLCGNEIGGYYCYLPIPYQESLKIVYEGNDMKFYQIQYRELGQGEACESFSYNYFNNSQELSKITGIWESKGHKLEGELREKADSLYINTFISRNDTAILFDINEGGRIVGLEFELTDDLLKYGDQLTFSVNWDNERQDAINVPFSSFFGYALSNSTMQSILLGTRDGVCYSNIPMPFYKSAKLALVADGKLLDKRIAIKGKIYFTAEQPDTNKEAKLYTQYRSEYNPAEGVPYKIAEVEGKGHYIGTILHAQGLEEGMTLFWEGDDRVDVDGEMRMHGTGSEDYFNGGWYAVHDRWDTGISLPIHGSLFYNLTTAGTGGYRFSLSDKVNFDRSYHMTIEHGPEENKLKVDYSSIAFFYADNPVYINRFEDREKEQIKRRDIIMAQDVVMKLYWFAEAKMQNDILSIAANKEDHWTTNIDFEAVPMVQISLAALEKGRYKATLVHKSVNGGNDISIWQRTTPLSQWISTDSGVADEIIVSDIGEITVTDQVKTLTIRKRKADNTVIKLDKIIFEKIDF